MATIMCRWGALYRDGVLDANLVTLCVTDGKKVRLIGAINMEDEPVVGAVADCHLDDLPVILEDFTGIVLVKPSYEVQGDQL